jgi:hypothetical protein
MPRRFACGQGVGLIADRFQSAALFPSLSAPLTDNTRRQSDGSHNRRRISNLKSLTAITIGVMYKKLVKFPPVLSSVSPCELHCVTCRNYDLWARMDICLFAVQQCFALALKASHILRAILAGNWLLL